MKLELWTVGQSSFAFVKEGCALYEKRLQQYFTFQTRVIPYLKNSKNLSEAQQKEQEGQAILKLLDPSDYLWLLDERGREFNSLELAERIQMRLNQSPKRIVFLIGGAYGFSDAVYERAQERLSLSRLTFSHQLVRVLALEQLYRAASILNNHPYHHE